MRILYFSDLHMEHWDRYQVVLPELPADDQYDVVVAAGDIGNGLQGVYWLEQVFPNHPVIFTPGNHEHYGQYFDIIQQVFAEYTGPVHILNPGVVDITVDDETVTFIGATCWSDLKLKGYQDITPQQVERGINDFRWDFTAAKMLELNKYQVVFIEDALDANAMFDNNSAVVVTHFVPTQLCISDKWKGDPFNPYFTNDLDWLMEEYKYAAHIFGHTHDRHDIIHPSGVHVAGNPHGYPGRESEGFTWKIMTV